MKIQFEITNACNYKCKICPRISLHNVPVKHMNEMLYKKILSKLPKSYEIVLTGWGEPFMHPKIYSLIDYTKNRGHKVSLTTNGALIDPEKLINTGIDSVSFSIDSVREDSLGHPPKGLKKIKQLIELRKKNKGKNPKIVFQAAILNPDDIFDVAKKAKELGVDRLNLTMLDERVGTIKNLKKIEVKSLIKRLNKIGIKFDLAQYAIGSGILRAGYKALKPILLKGRCLRTINYLYVNVDGFVTPCCNLPKFTIINATDVKKLTDALRTPKYKFFLKNHNRICQGCRIFSPLE